MWIIFIIIPKKQEVHYAFRKTIIPPPPTIIFDRIFEDMRGGEESK